MSKEIVTRITLPAAPHQAWAVLTDFAAYPTWNPFIHQIQGQCELGAKLRVTLRQPSGKHYVFMPTVTACEPGRLFQWRGALAGMHWLFSGVHSFDLQPMSHGSSTELIHKETFTGLLSSPILASVRADTTRGFEAMNLALQQRVEAALSKSGS